MDVMNCNNKVKNMQCICAFLSLVLMINTAGCIRRNVSTRERTYIGEASWYGRRFHGKTTASGERFNMRALTAAHPYLPFGTRVRVTHLDNGRTVVVRINDRGPFVKNRIIDLSYRAARSLGMIQQGVARVKLEILN
jgi:rare lipoprotein A